MEFLQALVHRVFGIVHAGDTVKQACHWTKSGGSAEDRTPRCGPAVPGAWPSQPSEVICGRLPPRHSIAASPLDQLSTPTLAGWAQERSWGREPGNVGGEPLLSCSLPDAEASCSECVDTRGLVLWGTEEEWRFPRGLMPTSSSLG